MGVPGPLPDPDAEDAPQREYDLRDVFDALRYVVKTGCQWAFLPHDFPPWTAVYQQARRWVAAGVFEEIAHDLRMILRLVDEREAQPTAAILDGRTLQSTPESGGRAGYDGAKKKKGSKVHIAVDTLGHLLALKVTAANEQERAQVAELAAKVQEVTGGTVEVAFVDQGYTGDAAAEQAAGERHPAGGGEAHRGQEGVRAVAAAVGGRADVRLARPVPPPGPRLRTADRNARRLALARLPHPAAAQARAPKCITGSSPQAADGLRVDRDGRPVGGDADGTPVLRPGRAGERHHPDPERKGGEPDLRRAGLRHDLRLLRGQGVFAEGEGEGGERLPDPDQAEGPGAVIRNAARGDRRSRRCGLGEPAGPTPHRYNNRFRDSSEGRFPMADWQRTHTCGELRETHVGQTVTLNGWVNTYRDLQRTRCSSTSATATASRRSSSRPTTPELFEAANELGRECVLSVTGDRPQAAAGQGAARHRHRARRSRRRRRCASSTAARRCRSSVTEFPDEELANEDLRLQYRYLDLRRPIAAAHADPAAPAEQGHPRLPRRAAASSEIETPLLGKSTPEGARDYLVPSRVFHGEWYALPQSPQLYKQLLMVAGYDKYFQIARCLRDEDLRADRQPEFTQLDVEMSFVERDDVLRRHRGAGGGHLREVPRREDRRLPFPRLTYADAMAKYGSDKPDLRFGLEIVDVTDLAGADRVPGVQGRDRGRRRRCAASTRRGRPTSSRNTDLKPGGELPKFVARRTRRKGLAWMKVEGDKFTGSIEKFFPDAVKAGAQGAAGRRGRATCCCSSPTRRRSSATRSGAADAPGTH